tara:strand:- start:18 stop:227 length:210 start_codon:yes stop_codon:yes gene_type:complete
MNDHELDSISAAEVVADEKHLKYERSRLAVLKVLEKNNLSRWARNYWNGVLRDLDRENDLYIMGVDSRK